MKEFLSQYWEDVVLLGAMAALAVVFVVLHLKERPGRRRRSEDGGKGEIDYERPGFDVDYGPGGRENSDGGDDKSRQAENPGV